MSALPPSSSDLRALAERRMKSLSRIYELTTGLLDIEDVGTLLRQIADSVKELFEFQKVSISILDPAQGHFSDHAMAGYSPEEEAEVNNSRDLFEASGIMADFREDCRISRIGYFIPSEKQNAPLEEFAVVQDKEAALAPRKSPDSWHELDLLYFSLYDRKGAMIGYLQVDYPVDGKIPSKETIEEIELFATIAAVGIENSGLYKKTLELLQENEMKTERMSRILDLIKSVLRVDEVDVVLKKVAETLAMTFGFRKTSVSLFSPGSDRVIVHALSGYTKEEEAQVRESVILRSKTLEDFKEEFRVTKTGYFIPAESQNPSDFVFMENPERAKMKRESPDSYHELDLLYFGVYDREGRIIGYLQPDYPINGKIPTKEAMESMEAFASIASIAIENSALFADMTEAERQTKMYLDLLTHDVGNFVGPVDAYLELLLGTTPLTDKQQKYLSSALEAVRSTSHLIRNVRRSAQMMEAEKVDIVPVNLTRSLRQTASDAKASALHRKVDIQLKMADRDIWVMADNLIDEVFYNLLTNAIKYDEHEAAVIEVEVEIVEVEGKRSAKVRIADHGIGIPDDLKDKVFAKGFKDLVRPDRLVLQKSRGAGMGLRLVKALVDRYGGKIWIENRVYDDYTRGSVFTVLLPKP